MTTPPPNDDEDFLRRACYEAECRNMELDCELQLRQAEIDWLRGELRIAQNQRDDANTRANNNRMAP